MTLTATPFTGTFVADRAHSSLQFSATHMGVGTFKAGFDDFDIRITADGDRVQLNGEVAAESVSITSPPEFREHVVNGSDFLDARNHPKISFRSLEVTFGDDGTFEGRGELSIKGVTRTIVATGSYRPLVEDPYGSMRTAIELHAVVDRRDWEIDWQAPLPGGGDALGYEIELTAHLELIRQV